MRVENIRTVQDVYRNQIVTNQYTTLIDPATNKRILTIETHKVDLYDSKGKQDEWTNKHIVDKTV
jgi:hypothetical protein